MTDYLGFVFLCTSDQFIICAFAMILQIPATYPVYMRETKNRMYRPTVYYFATLASAILTHFFYPLFVSLGSFYFIGFEISDQGAFWTWTGILAFMAFAGLCFGMFVGTVTQVSQSALEMLMNSLIVFYFGAGMLKNVSDQDGFSLIRILTWISPMRFADELGMRRMFAGKNDKIEETLLNLLGFTWGDTICYIAMAVWSLGFLFMGLGILLYKHSRS